MIRRFVALACLAAVACGEQKAVTPPQPEPVAPAPKPSAAAPVAPRKLTLIAGGDVALGRRLGQKIIGSPDHDPFARVQPWLAAADLRFVNLESVLSDQKGATVAPWSYLVFTGPPSGARTLRRAGIDVVSLANNHAWDYGRPALFETMGHLRDAGIAFAGVGETAGAAYEPAVLRVAGWSVAVFAVTDIWNQPPFEKHAGRNHVAWASEAELLPRIARARADHDLVILSYHGGGEYMTQPIEVTRQLARKAIEAGADAVIGHHPHVPQGIAWHDGRPVFYSLGNLVFEPWISGWAAVGYLARLTFERPHQPPTVDLCPYVIGQDDAPAPMADPARERRLRDRLERVSRVEGGVESGPTAPDGCFRATRAAGR
jgi:hypothetical protein